MAQKIYSVITGATSGIGKALTYKLASEGYNLILVGRNEEKLSDLYKDLEKKYEVKLLAYALDVTDKKGIDALGMWLKEEQIGIELFINNAGIGSFGKFFEVSKEVDREIIETNIMGLTYLLKVVSEYILKGGTILQVASTAAFAPGPYMSVYYASKAYVLSLSMAIREELSKSDIQVSILCPGPTQTAFQAKAKMQKADFANKLAMEAEEVAERAYKGILLGKAIIIPGAINKLAVRGMNLLPLQLKAKAVGWTQKK